MNNNYLTEKDEYNKYIKEKVKNAAFTKYCKLKQICEKKLGNVRYSEFVIQPNHISSDLSLPKKQLFWSLISKCYLPKMNFRKMNIESLMSKSYN